MPVTPLDPMTAAYEAIWAALRANATFSALVKAMSQNDYTDGTLQNIRAQVLPNDMPEVTLLQSAFTFHPFGGNSKIAEYTRTYALVTATDTMQVTTVNQVAQAVAGALYWGNLENATFNGNPYIREWHVTGGTEGSSGVMLPGVDAARSALRLSSIASIVVNMYVPRTSLPQ